MGIVFRKSGMMTTVQDLGRTGFQKDGFSPSGAVDFKSAKIANLLVDNSDNEAVIEFMMAGPEIEFATDAIIAITGGDFDSRLNGKPMPTYTAVYVNQGDILALKYAKTGVWGYLAVAGGLDIPVVMGSRSTNIKCSIGGFKGRPIKNGDRISLRERKQYIPTFLSREIGPEDFGQKEKIIRVVPGPQEDYFTYKGIEIFYNNEYTITSAADRMGFRLEGAEIEHKNGTDIISDGIPLGAIQIPSHGKPIIMLADRQTTGGYAKIGTVASVDIPAFVQSKEGTVIRFEKISVEEAQALLLKQEDQYKEMDKRFHRPCREVLELRNTARRIEKLFID